MWTCVNNITLFPPLNSDGKELCPLKIFVNLLHLDLFLLDLFLSKLLAMSVLLLRRFWLAGDGTGSVICGGLIEGHVTNLYDWYALPKQKNLKSITSVQHLVYHAAMFQTSFHLSIMRAVSSSSFQENEWYSFLTSYRTNTIKVQNYMTDEKS